MIPSPLRCDLPITLAAVALSLSTASPAWTQAPAQAPAPAEPVPIVMSISGAISVGSYQAGVNWAILEFMRRLRDDAAYRQAHGMPVFDLKAATGASAGNVNTLLWAIEWCTSTAVPASSDQIDVARPDSSLFWKVWVQVGLNSMLSGDRYEAERMDRAVLDRSRLRSITDPPFLDRLHDPRLIRGCGLPVGITLTRLQPGTIRYQGLEIASQRFATVFRAEVVPDSAVQHDGDRLHFLQLEGPVERQQNFGQLVRLVPREGRISTRDVLAAAEASAAFPVALAPVRLRVWHRDGDSWRSQTDVFIDGGVFDNNPVNLALSIYQFEQEAESATEVGPALVLYVNPFRYRSLLSVVRESGIGAPPAEGGVAALVSFLSGFIPTARQYELQLLARERQVQTSIARELRDGRLTDRLDFLQPEERARLMESLDSLTDVLPSLRRDSLLFTSRAYPIFGEHLGSFAGFLGRPLREYDFFVGTYDGFHFVAAEFLCGSRSAAADKQACIRQEMGEIIRDPRYVPAVSRRLLATLHDWEHFPDRHPLERPALIAEIDPPNTLEDRKTDRILLALYRSAAIDLDRSPGSCSGVASLVERLFCKDGLAQMFGAFQADVEPDSRYADVGSVDQILDEWNATCRTEEPGACRAAREFLRLVRRTSVYAPVIAERVLRRAEDVERALRDASQPHQLPLLVGLNALYHTTHMRSRGRIELSPTRPQSASRLWSVVPYSVGGQVGRSGWEVRYRPTLNLNRRWAVTVPIAWYDDRERRLNATAQRALGLGLGIAYRDPMPTAEVLFPEIGLEATAYRAGRWKGGEPYDWWTSSEIYGTFLGGYLRLSWRFDHTERWWLFGSGGPHHGGIGVAFADIGGLVYWIWRLR